MAATSPISAASHAAFGGGDFLLTSVNMRWYWSNFLGGEADDTTSLAAPVRSDLADLPPLYLSAAGLDPLRDDTSRLAQRLSEAGARFRFDHVPGVVHGCLRIGQRRIGGEGGAAQTDQHLPLGTRRKLLLRVLGTGGDDADALVAHGAAHRARLAGRVAAQGGDAHLHRAVMIGERVRPEALTDPGQQTLRRRGADDSDAAERRGRRTRPRLPPATPPSGRGADRGR